MAGKLIPQDEITFSPLNKRRLTQETCRKFGYGTAMWKGKNVQVAPYYSANGELVAQKIRDADKNFIVLGDLKEATLFGQRLWSPGRKVVVTEGEIDCLSVSQVQGNRWPVVSLPNGASGAKKAVKGSYEWLCEFDEVVLMFDEDEPGRKAAQEICALLPHGKAKVATLAYKDPNEALQAGDEKAITTAMWNAQVHRPDGILNGADLWDVATKRIEASPWHIPWPGLQDKLMGHRLGEILTLTAGSGVGKSEFARAMIYKLLKSGEKVGIVALEESVQRTALGLMALEMGKPLHLGGVPADDMKQAFADTLGTGRAFIYDHWGSHDSDSLLAKMQFMVAAEECKFVLLDHLSIVVSGMMEDDERKTIDKLMTNLRSMVEEYNFHLILVSHLKRPQGTPHEEGGRTSLGQLRGSAAIAQLSDLVVGIERDQQDPDEGNVSTFRVLKNRFCGRTGIAGRVLFEEKTGLLTDYEEEELGGDDTEF